MRNFQKTDNTYVSSIKIGKQRYNEKGYMDPETVSQVAIEIYGTRKLAICIPTYQRADIVEELISKYMEIYTELGADVYIYDSSEDNSTEAVTQKYKEKFCNLFYIRMPTELHSNMKVYKIFQKYGFRKNYDYVWVCSDSIRWKKNVLDKVSELLNVSLDIIVVNYRDEENIGDKYYHNPFDFFVECGWHLTLYGAVLLNTHTMLENVIWKEMYEKYNVPERVNHSHLCFYFEKILKLGYFSAVHLSFPTGSLSSSTLKDYSGWRNDTFYVFGYCFPNAINALPEYYNKAKNIVILKNGKYGDIFNERNLLALRTDNLFDMRIYREYWSMWGILTDLPRWKIKQIAKMKPQRAKKKRQNLSRNIKKVIKQKIQISHLKNFTKQFSQIYIYGAGICAMRYSEYLDKMHIPYEGFIVTKADGQKELNHHKIIVLDEIDITNPSIGIVLGLNLNNKIEVKDELEKRNAKNGIFDEHIIA